MMLEASRTGNRWQSAWPDLLAFAGGLAVAWFAGWNTTDLVWSLWLASLVIGYAMIVRMIFSRVAGSPGQVWGGLFVLMFFTFHFGMFHFVHSVFLGLFFPMGTKAGDFLDATNYAEVVRRYWIFLPVAALAEREHFRRPVSGAVADGSALRKGRSKDLGGAMMAPYRNVIRLHLLIFFFAAAHYAKLDHFLVYAVVYAVYFFPWRLVKKDAENGNG